MTASALPPLVSPEQLHDILTDPQVVVLDASTALHLHGEGEPYTAEGLRSAYAEAHVPGAVFADVPGVLSDPGAPFAFTVPAPDALAAAFAGLGVGDGTRVVVYDTVGNAWATRVWWLLRYLGHDAVSVLDGGLGAWRAAGYDVESGDVAPDPAPALTPRVREELLARTDDVAAAAGSGRGLVLNALDPATYRGEQEVSPYARRGRIPGSVNLPLFTLLDPATGRFLPEPELVERLQASGVLGADRTISYCGGGIAATLPAFAAYLVAGAEVAVYDGSLSEWTADERRPVEIG